MIILLFFVVKNDNTLRKIIFDFKISAFNKKNTQFKVEKTSAEKLMVSLQDKLSISNLKSTQEEFLKIKEENIKTF